MKVSTFDLLGYVNGDFSQKESFLKFIEKDEVVRIVNHTVNAKLIEKVLDMVCEYFSLNAQDVTRVWVEGDFEISKVDGFADAIKLLMDSLKECAKIIASIMELNKTEYTLSFGVGDLRLAGAVGLVLRNDGLYLMSPTRKDIFSLPQLNSRYYVYLSFMEN